MTRFIQRLTLASLESSSNNSFPHNKTAPDLDFSADLSYALKKERIDSALRPITQEFNPLTSSQPSSGRRSGRKTMDGRPKKITISYLSVLFKRMLPLPMSEFPDLFAKQLRCSDALISAGKSVLKCRRSHLGINIIAQKEQNKIKIRE